MGGGGDFHLGGETIFGLFAGKFSGGGETIFGGGELKKFSRAFGAKIFIPPQKILAEMVWLPMRQGLILHFTVNA